MARADLHIHSKYSDRPTEWFLKKVGASQSYSEPEAIYQMAKARGMDYVTITDHNEIAGSLYLSEKYSDAFTGVECCTLFPEDKCKVHILLYGLTGQQFDEIQKLRNNIYDLREYIVDQNLAYSVAHAAHPVNGRTSLLHLEKLVLLFDVFEVINGARNRSTNLAWYRFLQNLTEGKINELNRKHGITPSNDRPWIKGYTGGSDDHALLYLGKTITTADAANREDFLYQIRRKKSQAEGRNNDFRGLVFTIYKIAYEFSKNKKRGFGEAMLLDSLVNLVFSERDVSFKDRLSLALLKVSGRDSIKNHLIELLEEIKSQSQVSQEERFNIAYNKISDIADSLIVSNIEALTENLTGGKINKLISDISTIIPALFLFVPFFSSVRLMHGNRPLLDQLNRALPEQTNKRILWFSDTYNDLNGVSVTLKKLGWKLWSSGVDIRFVSILLDDELSDDIPPNLMNLKACYHFRLPYYDQYRFKVPSLLKALKEFSEFEPDEIYISTPGAIGMLGLITGKLFSIPVRGIYHTDFTLELGEIVADDTIVEHMDGYTHWFYSVMDEIKVPTRSYMDILESRGMDRSKMSIFPRHIDNDAFSYHPPETWNGEKLNLPDGINLLYVGRVSKDKNLEFLVNVYHEALKHRKDINLIVVGNGPYLDEMKASVNGNGRVHFTGRVPNESLPMLYSQAHALVFPSVTDTYGMAVLEAQCCELPAIVSDQGGPQEIIIDGRTGFVKPGLNMEHWLEAILDFGQMVSDRPDEYREMRRATRLRGIEISRWDNVLRQFTHENYRPTPEEIIPKV